MPILLLALLVAASGRAGGSELMRGPGVRVVFEPPSRAAAEEVVSVYPRLMAEVSGALGITPVFPAEPTVVLSTDFKRLSGGAPIVAFARASDGLIVMDISHAFKRPADLASTLKHELSHLALAGAAGEERLPLWLNEGVSQWASGGVSELSIPGESTLLEEAVVTGRLIPLGGLEHRFPQGGRPLRLAYEESLSVVEYITGEYGEDGLRRLLGLLEGMPLTEALAEAFATDMEGLERGWREQLRVRHTWLTYLSNNIYIALFVLAALVTLAGFVRVLVRLRTYRDDDGEGSHQEGTD